MVEYKTLRVPEPAWKEAKAQKEDEGRTWGEQIVRPDDEDEAATSAPADPETIAAEFARVFDYEENARKTAEQLEGRMR